MILLFSSFLINLCFRVHNLHDLHLLQFVYWHISSPYQSYSSSKTHTWIWVLPTSRLLGRTDVRPTAPPPWPFRTEVTYVQHWPWKEFFHISCAACCITPLKTWLFCEGTSYPNKSIFRKLLLAWSNRSLWKQGPFTKYGISLCHTTFSTHKPCDFGQLNLPEQSHINSATKPNYFHVCNISYPISDSFLFKNSQRIPAVPRE